MALIGLMEQHLVDRHKEVTQEDLTEGIAIGQILPGPVAVDCAAHIGYRLRGVIGAIVSSAALTFPPFLLMLIVTPLYLHHGRVPEVAAFFAGVGPAVVAVIVAAAWRLSSRFVTDLASVLIAAAACAGVILQHHPILIILEAGLVGLLLKGGERWSGPKWEWARKR
jgi:chromate transporter